MSLPKTAEIAILATTGSVLYVGKTSAERGRITFTTDDVLTRTVDITRIQVPPRAPRKASKSKDFGAFFLLLLTSLYIVCTLGKQKSKQSVCFDKH